MRLVHELTHPRRLYHPPHELPGVDFVDLHGGTAQNGEAVAVR